MSLSHNGITLICFLPKWNPDWDPALDCSLFFCCCCCCSLSLLFFWEIIPFLWSLFFSFNYFFPYVCFIFVQLRSYGGVIYFPTLLCSIIHQLYFWCIFIHAYNANGLTLSICNTLKLYNHLSKSFICLIPGTLVALLSVL